MAERRIGPGAPVDEDGWPPRMDGEGRTSFLEVVDEAFGEIGRSWCRTGLGVVTEDGDGETVRIGLVNLAVVCAGSPQHEWPDIVRRFLDLGDGLKGAALSVVRDAEALLNGARLRLHGEDVVLDIETTPAYRRVGDDLVAVVVVDLEGGVAMVDEGHLAALDLALDDVFARAVVNTLRDVPYELDFLTDDVLPDVVPAGSSMLLLTGSHPCAAAHAIWPDRWAPVVPEHGLVVGVPDRHTVLALPVLPGSTTPEAVLRTLVVSIELYRQGDGPLSPGLHWWRDGWLARLPAGPEPTVEERARLTELVELLDP